MASETTTANPELPQTQVASLLVQPLEAASVVLSSGVRIFDTSSPLRIPKLTQGATVGFVGESQLIPEADVDFGEVSLMPSTLKSLKTLIRFSNELLRQSVIGLDATLKARLVTDVSSKLDTALLTGDGASNTIKGIINQTGVQTGVLDVADADSLLDAIALASAAEVTPNRWFVNGADFISLRKLKETAGSAEYLIESDVTAGPTYRLFGVPVTVTNKLPVSKAVLADTSQIAVARDLATSVTMLSERYAEFDEQAIRVVTRYDLGLLHLEGSQRIDGHALMPEVYPADVTSLTQGDVATVVEIVTAMAKAYTRGQGFDVAGEPNPEIGAVIVTASARLAANGAQLPVSNTAGVFTQDVRSGFTGWTLAELAVLNRYRKRAM